MSEWELGQLSHDLHVLSRGSEQAAATALVRNERRPKEADPVSRAGPSFGSSLRPPAEPSGWRYHCARCARSPSDLLVHLQAVEVVSVRHHLAAADLRDPHSISHERAARRLMYNSAALDRLAGMGSSTPPLDRDQVALGNHSQRLDMDVREGRNEGFRVLNELTGSSGD